MPMRPFVQNCQRNANTPFASSAASSSYPFCSVCNRSTALANGLIVNGTICLSSDNNNCGKVGHKCRDYQTCTQGQCTCTLSPYQFLDWRPFFDVNPDPSTLVDFTGRPQSGCNADLFASLIEGAVSRVWADLFGLVSCYQITNSSLNQITPALFKDSNYMALMCSGASGHCPLSACQAMYRNLTGDHRNLLCDAVHQTTSVLKSCAQNYAVANRDGGGDLTCANVQVQYMYTGGGPPSMSPLALSDTTVSYIELFNFLGCDQTHDDLVLPTGTYGGNLAGSFKYRTQTLLSLMGGGNRMSVSVIVSVFVLLVTLILA